MDEQKLLNQFVQHGSSEAFEQLVRRNIDMVHSAARRQVGNSAMAEDVTQAVFVLLARKAAKIRGPLAGWLILTTHYAATNAKKLADRRQFHERQAGQMKLRESQPPDQSEWDSYAPLLDGALTRLAQRDRDAVALRYFQSASYKDVAAALGISEEAARKRVDRATDRLRQILSNSIALPAAFVTQLAQHGSETAPSQIIQRIVQSSGTTGSVTTAATIVRAVNTAMILTKLKIIAIFLLILAAGAGVAIAVHTKFHQPAAQVPFAATPAPTPEKPAENLDQADESESQIPGIVRLVQWDMILSDTGASAVSSVGQPIRSPSKVYQSMRFDADDLRDAVAGAMVGGQVIRTSRRTSVVDLNPIHYPGWTSPQLMFDYQPENQGPFFWASGISLRHSDEIDRIDADRIHLKLDHPDLNFGIADRPGNLRRSPGGNGILYDGELTAGDAIAFLARLLGPTGNSYNHLAVWEAFKALPSQMAAVDLPRDSAWWCQHGPSALRHRADIERIWAANASLGRNLGPPSIERKLDDGRSVWLMALCRPQKWPFCWWDPTGKPASPWAGAIPIDNDPPPGLWVQVGVSVPPQLSKKLPAANQDADDISSMGPQCYPIPDNATQLDVGIPVGPWKEIARLKYGGSIEVDGLHYQMDDHINSSTNWLNLTVSGVVNDQIRVEPIYDDGIPSQERIDDGGPIKWSNDSFPREVKLSVPALGIGGKKADAFNITRRKRQFVSFAGFAAQPIVPPKTDLTTQQIQIELASLRNRDLQKYLDALPTHREFVFAFFGEDPTDWDDAMESLLHAAAMGNEQAVRQLLTAQDPQVIILLNDIAHLFILGESIRIQSFRQFGERTTHQLLDRPGLFEDLEAELASCGWTQAIDQQSPSGADMEISDDLVESLVWRMGNDGKYRLNVDGLAERPNLAAELALKIKTGNEVNRALSLGMTVEELKLRLRPLLPAAAASEP